MKYNKNKIFKIIAYFIIISLIAYLLYKWEFLREIIKVSFISFVIAYFLKPLHEKLMKRGISSKFSSLIILVGLVTIIIITFSILIPIILEQSSDIASLGGELHGYFMGLTEKIKFISDNYIFENILEKLTGVFSVFLEKSLEKIINFGENILTYFLIPILIYYFLSDRELMGNRFLMFFPIENRGVIKNIFRDIDKSLGRYIVSQFLLCIIIGILTFITLRLLKIEYAFILSLINGIFNIVPYFGPVFGAIPTVFIALLISPKKALWTLFWLFVLQQLEGDVISPKIIGESVSMHPVLVMILLIAGGELGGLLGMVIAVPVGVALKVIYEDINYYLF